MIYPYISYSGDGYFSIVANCVLGLTAKMNNACPYHVIFEAKDPKVGIIQIETQMNNLNPILQSLLAIFTNVFSSLLTPIFDGLVFTVVDIIS